jgi:hypothetical protein
VSDYLTNFKEHNSFGFDSPTGLVNALRERARRVAGGGPSDRTYDPESLCLEGDAAKLIEALLHELEVTSELLKESQEAHEETKLTLRRTRFRVVDAPVQRLGCRCGVSNGVCPVHRDQEDGP